LGSSWLIFEIGSIADEFTVGVEDAVLVHELSQSFALLWGGVDIHRHEFEMMIDILKNLGAEALKMMKG
jgi:hypothetical protein